MSDETDDVVATERPTAPRRGAVRGRPRGAELGSWPLILLYELVIVNLVIFGLMADTRPWLRVTNVAVAAVGQAWNGYHAARRLRAS